MLIGTARDPQRKNRTRPVLTSLLAGIAPMVAFKLFMTITDQHIDRPVVPENIDALTAGPGSLLIPSFGPLGKIMPGLLKIPLSNFEGYCYLGLFLICITIFTLPVMVFKRSNFQTKKETGAIFISSMVLLMLALGTHNKLLELMHTRFPLLDQFRSLWAFYLVLLLRISRFFDLNPLPWNEKPVSK
jgi:hypothetical protein